MRNAHEVNPIGNRLALAVLAALTVAVLFAASAPQAQAQSGATSSQEERTVIDLSGTQQFNPCVPETLTITRGKDTIRTRTQERPNGGVRIETRDQSEGVGVGDLSGLKYSYNELFESRTESSESTFELRFQHRKHLVRQKDNPRNDDYFEREETRLRVVNGETQAEKSTQQIECR